MPGVSFTPEQILSSGEMPAGFYNIMATSMFEGPGKNDPTSTTWTTLFVVQDGEFKGREIKYWFSTNMIKPMFRYLKAFGVTLKAGENYPIEDTVNKPVKGYLVWDISNLDMTIKDFAPAARS